MLGLNSLGVNSPGVAAKIGLISNPGSGHNRTQFEQIAARIDAQPNILHCVTHSPDDILHALERFAEAGIETLAINGGDGTASAVLGCLFDSELFEQHPRVALLPGGTANMNAGDIGVKGSLKAAVARFCEWAGSDSPSAPSTESRALLRVAASNGPLWCTA